MWRTRPGTPIPPFFLRAHSRTSHHTMLKQDPQNKTCGRPAREREVQGSERRVAGTHSSF